MRKKKNNNDMNDDGKEWMNTYADMMSLLLTFFVFMFSIATVDANKFESIISSFQGYTGILNGSKIINTDINKLHNTNNKEDEEFLKMYQQIETYLKQNNLNKSIDVVLNDKGLLLRFKDSILFDTGKAVIRPEAISMLERFSGILKNVNNPIRVEGYTDNIPISNGIYKSNWELSTDRAVNVVKYFINIQKMKPELFSAAGYGEYHPIAPNNNEINRSRNRRVEIVILKKTNDNLPI